MDNYDKMSDIFSSNYGRIEEAINNTYAQLKENPENEPLKAALFELCEVAKSVVNTQLDFTELYCDEVFKDDIINNLAEKYNTIDKFISSDFDLSNHTR
nr:hypothetical protein [Bacilli bacterium]